MNKIKKLWNGLPDGVRRVAHTTWQVGLSTLIAQLVIARSSQDVKAALTIALAASLAALKAAVVSRG